MKETTSYSETTVYCNECNEEIDRCDECNLSFSEDETIFCDEMNSNHYCDSCGRDKLNEDDEDEDDEDEI